MQATTFDIESLQAAQQADFDIMHLTRELEELPQRQIILDCRQKREAMQAKVKQIEDVERGIKKKRTHVTDEDASLEKKERGVQAAIDAAAGDYRNVEARTKELNGIFKRRTALADELAKIDAERDKVMALKEQAARALEDINATEEEATNVFKREGSRLKVSIAQAEHKREELLESITDELASAYREASERMGVVVVGNLEDGRCGVCRAAIDPGRLIEVRAQAPVTFCPICHRLMIVS